MFGKEESAEDLSNIKYNDKIKKKKRKEKEKSQVLKKRKSEKIERKAQSAKKVKNFSLVLCLI